MAANKEQHPHRDLPEEQPAHRSPSLPNTSAGAGAGAGSDEGGSGGGGGAAGADEAWRGLDGSALSISISGEGKMLGQVSALLAQLDTHLTAIVRSVSLNACTHLNNQRLHTMLPRFLFLCMHPSH